MSLSQSIFLNSKEPSSHFLDWHWTPNILLLLSTVPDLSDAIFTNFSHEPTWRWYFAMTPFEAFFLGLIVTQFAVLNMLGIFPLNLSAVINGMANGRRRKREAPQVYQRKKDIASQLLKLMKKLDPDECSFKAICELELHTKFTVRNDTQISKGILSVLSGLKLISKKRETGEFPFNKRPLTEKNSLFNLEIPGIDKGDDDVIAQYEEAVKIASSAAHNSEGNENLGACENRYHRCPATGDEILGYVEMMKSIDDLIQF